MFRVSAEDGRGADVVPVSVVIPVATTTKTRSSSSSKAKKPTPSSRSPKGRGKAGKSTSSASRKTTGSRRRETPTRTRSARRDVVVPRAERVLSGHRRDIWGVFFVVLGLITGLGVYLDSAGPIGNGLARFFGSVVGLARVLLPLAFVAVGIVLIRGHLRRRPAIALDDPRAIEDAVTAEARAEEQGIRMAIGGLLALIAGAGLLHLWVGRPTWRDPIDDFVAAGGFLGWLIGAPVAAAFGAIGGAIVLVAILVVGMIIITALSLVRWFGHGVARIDAFGGWAQRAWCTLIGAPLPAAVAPDAAVVDPSAPIIVGGERVGEYRRGGAKSAKQATSTAAEQTAQIEDPLLKGKKGSSTSFSDLAGDPKAKPADEAAADAAPAPKPKPRKKPKITVSDSGPGEQTQLELGPSVADSAWKLPSLSLLNSGGERAVDQGAVADAGQTLERALASHGVDAHLVGMVVGPTVTRFELELGEGVKVSKITSLSKDIAYAMASADVRILAPIPGRQAIGVEVPNSDRQVVALGDLLRSKEATKAKHPLEVAVGRDIQGKAKLMNLAKMPHLLIAGATGSGKSSCINSIITSVLMRSTPAEVRMILVDPKMVEMTQYERVPHLLTQPVTDPRKAANALAWACREMDRRYQLLAEKGFRDIAGFNKAVAAGDFDKENAVIEGDDEDTRRQTKHMPFILVVVDELADLMMVAARDVEDSICRIAQKARAVGIHLVIATQRPSTNVITGIIKANVPARMAFSVSSLTDSRVILDQAGAERLIGQGDMLMLSPTSSAADRIQGCWVEESEVRKVVEEWRSQSEKFKIDESVNEAEIVEGSSSPDGTTSSGGGGGGATGDGGTDDELYLQARELVVSSQLGSTSMLQRKLKVGFARAGRLMDLLEENGVVGPSVGSKAREVLISEAEDEA